MLPVLKLYQQHLDWCRFWNVSTTFEMLTVLKLFDNIWDAVGFETFRQHLESSQFWNFSATFGILPGFETFSATLGVLPVFETFSTTLGIAAGFDVWSQLWVDLQHHSDNLKSSQENFKSKSVRTPNNTGKISTTTGRFQTYATGRIPNPSCWPNSIRCRLNFKCQKI